MSTAQPLSRPQILVGHGAIVVTTLLWGSLIPFIDILLASFDAYALSALRYGLATLAIVPYVLLRKTWHLRTLPLRKVILLGACGIAGFTTCYTLGIRFSNVGTAVVVNSATPVVAALFAAFIYRMPIERGVGLALILAGAGGAVASLGAESASGMGFRGGELLFVAAALCWSWYSINAQKWLGHLQQSELTAVTMVSATAALAVIFGVASLLGETKPMRWPSLGTLTLLGFVGFGATLVGVMFWNVAVARLGVVVASLYLSLIPVIGMATAALLGKPPTSLQFTGAILVTGGIVQLHLRRLRRRSRIKPAG